MKYIIVKEIEAKNLSEAIENESKAEIVEINKQENEDKPNKIGFQE